MENTLLTAVLVILAILIFLAFIRAVIGPKFTDRIVAVNCINTMIIVMIVILSYYRHADYLTDVAIIYALLGFTANVVLTRILLSRHARKQKNDTPPAGQAEESPRKEEA